MKKNVMLIVIIMMTTVVTTARAEVIDGSFSFTPNIGGYVFEGNENNKNAVAVGLRAGYNFTENLGVEGFFNYVPSNYKDTNDTNNIYVCGIEGLYHFMPYSRFVPFVAIGVGAIHYNSDDSRFVPTKFAFDYGAGLKFFLTDVIALRADVRHVLPLNGYNEFLYTLGISFSFGGQKKVVCYTEIEEPAVLVVPAPVPVPEPAPTPAPVQKKVSITLNVEFDTAKAVIKEKYNDEVKKVADFMKVHPNTNAVIEGHTDNVGSDDYNIRLSHARANSVREYLINKFGIKASRITATGYGKNKPIASNDTEEGRQKNRRVEAVLEAIEIK